LFAALRSEFFDRQQAVVTKQLHIFVGLMIIMIAIWMGVQLVLIIMTQ
jgi:hypothetical protein